MKIRKHSNRKIIIITLVVLALVAGGITYAAVTHNRTAKRDQAKEAKQDSHKKTIKTSDNHTDKTVTTENGKTNQSHLTNQGTGKAPARYEGGSTQSQPSLTGSVSIATPVNETMRVRVTINQWIDDPNGKCELTLTRPNGQAYTDQAKLIANPQTSSCYGWDIPVSKLGQVKGHWVVKVVASGGGKTGTITDEVDL